MEEDKKFTYWFYKIENKINSKKYIGLTSNVARRQLRHFTDLLTQRHHNSFLQKEYNLFGKEAFSFEIIEEKSLSVKEASKREIFWIQNFDSYNNGYNQNPGGLGGHTGATNGGSHLIESDIYAINSALEFSSRPGAVLSEIFNVTTTTISRIKKGSSHFQYTLKYQKLDYDKRFEIFKSFCQSSDFISKKRNSTIMPSSKRKLNEFQVHCVLLNEEQGRIVPLKRLARYFNVRGNVLTEIINDRSYRDYRDTFLKKTSEEKQEMASFLCEQEKQTSRIAGTPLRATNHNISEKKI